MIYMNCNKKNETTNQQLTGPYLGQGPPGIKPALFAPGIVSTDQVELNAVFSPEGDLFYFTRKNPDGLYVIMEMKRIEGKWTNPKIAPFSGVYEEADPIFSHDGEHLFYISKKPEKGFGPPHDILILKKEPGVWSEPINPGPPLNTEHNEIYPCITSDGTLYFNSDRPGSLGRRDFYKCRWIDGQFTEPENLGPPFSSEYNEGDIYVSPDKQYIIFVSVDRPNSYGSGDLYISFRDADDTWSTPVNMGETINSEGCDYSPIVTHNGKYFFFTKQNDIYWVDTKIFDEYRSNK